MSMRRRVYKLCGITVWSVTLTVIDPEDDDAKEGQYRGDSTASAHSIGFVRPDLPTYHREGW